MSMRRRRYAHSVSASVARAVVIAVVVSSLIKLLTVTACAFVPVMSFVLLPLCFGSMRDMSESRCDLPSADATYLGIGFCSRACRYVILLGIGYGASVLRTYVPMSACILFPFAGKAVGNLSYCVTNLASGVTSIVRIVAVRSFFEMLIASRTSVPVMRVVISPYGCRTVSVTKLCRHLILTSRAILCGFFGCRRDIGCMRDNFFDFFTPYANVSVSVFGNIAPFTSIVVMATQITVFSATNRANCFIFTSRRATAMSDLATLFNFITNTTFVPVVGSVFIKNGVLMCYCSYVSACAINVASVVELMRGLVYLIGVATGTFEPVAIFVIAVFSARNVVYVSRCGSDYVSAFGT